MNLKRYLSAVERQYRYRIKTVAPVDDTAMDRIEQCIAKYRPISIDGPKKTPIQRTPLDFHDIQNREVWIIEVVLTLPASPYVLIQDIRNALNIPERYVVVQGEGDMLDIAGQTKAAIEDIEAEALKRGLKPASAMMGSDYPEADHDAGTDLAGPGRTSRLLGYLAAIRDKEAKETVATGIPLFSWLPKAEGVPEDNFNQDIKGNVPAKAKPVSTEDDRITKHGNVAHATTIRRVYVDDAGKRVVLTRELGKDA